MEHINIPVSPGELLDKITILEIKAERIQDEQKLKNVETELDLLQQAWTRNVFENDELQSLKRQLRDSNRRLWEIEDEIRIRESHKKFDARFIELARSVYIQNDKRATIKRKINEQLGAAIMEEKHYAEY